MADSLEELRQALRRAPVMGNVHPLVPLCLPAAAEVTSDAQAIAEELDDPKTHLERPVLITGYDERYGDRFLVRHSPDCPSPAAINQALPARLLDIPRHLLTIGQVAERIVTDARQRNYHTVALVIVDGLSYDDVKGWPELVEPCFVYGPSTTYARVSDGGLAADVGFPTIVGDPAVARRLVDAGITHSRGYSYWDRKENELTKIIFRGIPLWRVRGTAAALGAVETSKLPGLYLQFVREGLDGLAHRRREVTIGEVRATVDAIHDDYRLLASLLAATGARGAAYLTADHGVLWKEQHDLHLLEHARAEHPRYATASHPELEHASLLELESGRYQLLHYPYLAAAIPRNDSGVHGGLSYWESIVPFVRVEVNV